MIDEVQYAIANEELRGIEPPRLYGVLNGLLRMRNVGVYVTGSNSKLLSSDVMTQFRGRGDEVLVRPFSFSEFMQGFNGDEHRGWAEYAVFGGMTLTRSMRTDEQKSRYLERLFAETYLKDIVARNKVEKTQELEDLIDILASSIGSLTNPPKIKATLKSERATIRSKKGDSAFDLASCQLKNQDAAAPVRSDPMLGGFAQHRDICPTAHLTSPCSRSCGRKSAKRA